MRGRIGALLVIHLLLGVGAASGQVDVQDLSPEEGRKLVAWIFQGLGVLLMGGGLWAMFRGGRAADLLEAMEGTPLVEGAALTDRGYHAVQGTAEPLGSPLIAPRCRDEVVFYEYTQTEEWEEKDDEGGWRTVERVHKDETEAVPFRVVTEEGAVGVGLKGARLIGQRLHREQVGASGSATGVGGSGLGLTGQYRNHRYVHEVEGLLAGATVYVIGPTRDPGDGQVAFAADPSSGRPFVVSAYDRDELGERSQEKVQSSTLLTWALLGLGVLSLVTSRVLPPLLR